MRDSSASSRRPTLAPLPLADELFFFEDPFLEAVAEDEDDAEDEVDKDAEPSGEAPTQPAELKSLASDAQNVLLRFSN